MTRKQIESINRHFQELFNAETLTEAQSHIQYSDKQYAIDEFLSELVSRGKECQLIYLTHFLEEGEVKELIENQLPILVLVNRAGKQEPIIIRGNKRKGIDILFEETAGMPHNITDLLSLMVKAEGKFIVLTCIPRSEISEGSNEPSNNAIHSFLKLLSTEKREILFIYLYAVIGGIISLSLPLGIQSIVNFISSGSISTSVIVLIFLILIAVLVSGGMQIMQLYIVEHIQQKIFAKIAFNIADRIPRVKVESILKYYPPELINRFFDILTVQKGISSILIDLTSAVLQIFFGLILLSLYHPYFIFFGIVLVVILFLIIYFTGPKGLQTSNEESKYKYKLAYWLEEVARTLNTFKLAGNSNLPIEKTDYFTTHYLKARQKHFKVLMTQYFSFIGFKTFITGGLLILGCILVINREINIGQFVASEIVIILIMSAVEKVILKLERVYDILTSTYKLEQVTTLPVESSTGFDINQMAIGEGLSLQVNGLRYKYPDGNSYSLNGIDIDIRPGERICFTGQNGSGKTTLLNVLLGLLDRYEGSILYNKVSLKDINKRTFHQLVGNNLSEEEIFHSTLLENITLGRKEISLDKVTWALEFVGLQNFVSTLPEGLNSQIIGGNLRLPKNIIYKIILARSIVSMPRLLILDDFLLGIEKREKYNLVNQLMNRDHKWTIIIISNDPEVMQLCDKTVVLHGGKNICEGSFDVIKKEKFFEELV